MPDVHLPCLDDPGREPQTPALDVAGRVPQRITTTLLLLASLTAVGCASGEATRLSPDKQAQIHQGLDDHPKVTIHDYPGEDHGFAAEMGKRRSAAAAELADSRTEAFFAEHVG